MATFVLLLSVLVVGLGQGRRRSLTEDVASPSDLLGSLNSLDETLQRHLRRVKAQKAASTSNHDDEIPTSSAGTRGEKPTGALPPMGNVDQMSVQDLDQQIKKTMVAFQKDELSDAETDVSKLLQGYEQVLGPQLDKEGVPRIEFTKQNGERAETRVGEPGYPGPPISGSSSIAGLDKTLDKAISGFAHNDLDDAENAVEGLMDEYHKNIAPKLDMAGVPKVVSPSLLNVGVKQTVVPQKKTSSVFDKAWKDTKQTKSAGAEDLFNPFGSDKALKKEPSLKFPSMKSLLGGDNVIPKLMQPKLGPTKAKQLPSGGASPPPKGSRLSLGESVQKAGLDEIQRDLASLHLGDDLNKDFQPEPKTKKSNKLLSEELFGPTKQELKLKKPATSLTWDDAFGSVNDKAPKQKLKSVMLPKASTQDFLGPVQNKAFVPQPPQQIFEPKLAEVAPSDKVVASTSKVASTSFAANQFSQPHQQSQKLKPEKEFQNAGVQNDDFDSLFGAMSGDLAKPKKKESEESSVAESTIGYIVDQDSVSSNGLIFRYIIGSRVSDGLVGRYYWGLTPADGGMLRSVDVYNFGSGVSSDTGCFGSGITPRDRRGQIRIKCDMAPRRMYNLWFATDNNGNGRGLFMPPPERCELTTVPESKEDDGKITTTKTAFMDRPTTTKAATTTTSTTAAATKKAEAAIADPDKSTKKLLMSLVQLQIADMTLKELSLKFKLAHPKKDSQLYWLMTDNKEAMTADQVYQGTVGMLHGAFKPKLTDKEQSVQIEEDFKPEEHLKLWLAYDSDGEGNGLQLVGKPLDVMTPKADSEQSVAEINPTGKNEQTLEWEHVALGVMALQLVAVGVWVGKQRGKPTPMTEGLLEEEI